MATTQQDLFMQWYPVKVLLNASLSTTLAEESFTTGLSIRGRYAWLIHRVELECPTYIEFQAANELRLALSTVTGSATMPEMTSKGLITKLAKGLSFTTSGASSYFQPFVWDSLPPTIIASPKLSFYAQTAVDDTNLRGDPVYGRIGYTTIPIDDKLYLEIAETFETL